VRAPPTWREPVGEGAKRTRGATVARSTPLRGKSRAGTWMAVVAEKSLGKRDRGGRARRKVDATESIEMTIMSMNAKDVPMYRRMSWGRRVSF